MPGRGPPPTAMARLLLYAHHHPAHTVSPAVLHTLRHFRALGFELVFASTSPVDDLPAAQALADLGAQVLVVPNIGYDFYAWRCAWLAQAPGRLGRLQQLVLLNSSVQGPFHDLGGFLQRLQALPADVLGATLSLAPHPHLQSYFFLFKPAALQADGVHRFWQTLQPFADRERTIVHHELRLTQRLQALGLRVGAFHCATDQRNPALKHPYRLYAQGLPFLKVAKLRKPANWPLLLWLRLRQRWLAVPPAPPRPRRPPQPSAASATAT